MAVDFDRKGHLLVVEAGANAVSSYSIAHDGSLQVISPSVANGQAATCWIVVNQRGDVITTNPGTNSLSAFHVDAGTGQVTLLNGTAGAGNAPLDIDISENGRFAYAVDPGNGGVDMYKIESGRQPDRPGHRRRRSRASSPKGWRRADPAADKVRSV